MANNETLGAAFSIDVTNLKAGLSQANMLIRESESEFKAAAAGMDDWRDSQDGLEAKIKSLNSITDIQKKKVDALQAEYDRLVADGLDPTSKAAVELRTKINNETAALNKNENELEKQKNALEELGNESEETAEETEDMGEAAEEAGEKFSGLKAAGGIAAKAIAAVGTACVSAVGAFFGLAESTREARNNMAKLATSFETAGLSAQNAEDTFTELYGIMGDDGAATEAAQQLAKISKDEADLAANTRILTGVMAEYGASIPLEGLAEGMAATAAMSSVQGPLADALEWQGVNLDDVNAKLETLATEEERAAYIQEMLTGLYGESADAYRENNAQIIAAQKAQAELNAALNELGAIAEPIMTTLKTMAADLLKTITPFVKLMGDGLAGALAGADGAAASLAEGLTGIINVLLGKIVDLLPFVVETIVEVVPQLLSAILKQLPDIVQTVIDVVLKVVDALTKTLPQLLPEIVKAIMQIITTIVDNVPALLSAAIKFFTAIVDAIPKLIPIIMENLMEAVVSIIWGLLDAIPDLLQAAMQFFKAIVSAIPAIIEELTHYIPAIIQTIIDGLVEAIPLLLDAAVTLLMAIVDAIPTILDAIITNLPTIINAIVNGVTTAIPLLLDAAITLLMAIVDAIPTIVTALIDALPQIITTIIDGVLAALPQLLDAAVTLLMAIVDAFPTIINAIITNLPTIINAIVNGVLDALPQLLDAAITLLMALIDAIPVIVEELFKAMPQIIEAVLTCIANAIPKLFETAKSLFGKLLDAAGELIQSLPAKMREIISYIVDGLREGIAKVKTIGSDIVKGLWEGIKDMGSWIAKKIKGFGESVLGGLKSFFGIHSPSKVMADEVGKNLALGIGEGFADNIAGVNKKITGAMDVVGSGGVAGSSSGHGGSGKIVNVYQTNHYSQAHSRLELYKTKQNTAAAVRLALAGA